MLNLPGHHSTAAIVAEVVQTGDGKYSTEAYLQISDCDRRIRLDFCIHDLDDHENNLHKIDTLISSLRSFRRAVVKAQKRAVAMEADDA